MNTVLAIVSIVTALAVGAVSPGPSFGMLRGAGSATLRFIPAYEFGLPPRQLATGEAT